MTSRRCASSIETIDHSKQRYPTIGEWQVKPDGLHLALDAGVTQAAADKFDMTFEKHRLAGDKLDPGDDPRAPYHRQHEIASGVE